MDLGLRDRAILLDLGAGPVARAVADTCLAEGAYVALLHPGNSELDRYRGALAKRYGFRIRLITTDSRSSEAAARLLDDVERWAAPLAGFATVWRPGGAQGDQEAVDVMAAVVASRLQRGDGAILFLNGLTEGEPTGDVVPPSALRDEVEQWTTRAVHRVRANAMFAPGRLVESSERRSRAHTTGPDRKRQQTLDEALASMAVFLLSPRSSFISGRVVAFGEPGFLEL